MPAGSPDISESPRSAAAPMRLQLGTLLAVLAVAMAMRGWLVANTDAISQDGTLYIQMAAGWSDDPRAVIEEYDYPVGYPLALRGVHRGLRAVGAPDDLRTWELAGQVVSLAGALLAVAAVWLLGGLTLNWDVAWIGALLWGVARKWVQVGADVLSDAPAVGMQLWAVALGVLAARRLERRSAWGIVWAALAGVAAGAGYHFRPEALAVTVVVVALCLLPVVMRRARWWQGGLGVLACGAAAALVALPYMLAIGGLTKKKDLSDILITARPGGGVVAMLAASRETEAFWHFWDMVSQAMHPVLLGLAGVWLAGWIVRRAGWPRLPEGSWSAPDRFGVLAGAGVLAVYVPMVVGLYLSVGYMSHRHVLIAAGILAPLSGAGLILLAGVANAILRAIGLRIGPLLAPRLLLVAIIVPLVLYTLQPLHNDKAHLRRGGEFLNRHAAGEAYVLVDDRRVLHYAQRPGGRFYEHEMLAQGAADRVMASGAEYIALSSRTIRQHGLEALVESPGLELVEEFPGPRGRDVLRVYRVRAPGERLTLAGWAAGGVE